MSTRKLTQGLLLVALALSFTAVHIPLAAQEPRAAQFGDPPIAELISISEPNENGVVVIRGNQGAVFPGAVVEVRNLYTGDTAYTRAELTGVFAAEIYGPGNTPFWISPATNIDASERFRPGSLHGGPGVILYGPLPESYPPPPEAPPEVAAQPQTPIRIDGDSGEWAGQVEPMAVELEGQGALFYALANRESLYLALAPQEGAQPLPDDYSRLEIDLEIDERLFSVALDPRRGGGGRAYEHLSGPDADLGPLGGVSAQGAAIEVRVPRLAFTGAPAPLTLWALRFIRGEEEAAAPTVELSLLVEEVDAIDSRMVEPLPMGEEAVPFTLSGPVGGGSGRWQAVGRVNGLQFEAGDRLLLELQVSMQAPEMPGSGEDLRLGAALRLEPVVGASGAQTVADRATGNGWSGLLTPTGLPIENVAGGIALGEAGAQNLVIQEGGLSFLLQWQVSLEEGLPPGLYVPVIDGFVAVTGLYGAWGEAGILGNGPGAGIAEARLPVVLRVGGPGENRLLWTLLQDHPSQGSRGILAAEDAGRVALSSRVAFQAERTILPRVDPANGEPIPYPLEPYLPALLGNSFTESVAPLVPFAFQAGELRVRVTMPDGAVDDLGAAPLVQNRLSSPARVEAELFGRNAPVDMYRLTTLDPRFTAYTFQQEGRHVIEMRGTVRDVWGNVYTGGGTYELWIAEPLELLPGVLPGTPFEVGDAFLPALSIVPAFPAEVTMRLRLYPLEGGRPVTYEAEGRASAYGYFLAEEAAPWLLEGPGEYVVDYTASYRDPLGRLWMGSVRGAGVIASPEGTLVARGGRGVANVPAEDRLAWYALDNVAPNLLASNPEAHLRWPYYSGDVLWGRDGTGSVQATLRLMDTGSGYEAWLVDRLAGWRADDGMAARELANEDELPLVTLGPAGGALGPALEPEGIVNRAYAYFSAVRPGVAVRQFVLGDESPGLARTAWDFDDPYNQQRGVGANGDLPGDYAFLFGGAVVHNAALNLHEAAIYGAVAVVVGGRDTPGDRVYPPLRGAANGPDGGPLLTVRNQEVGVFFVPTGFRPGQVFTVGDRLALAGQVAPALAARVEADVVRPDGIVLPIIGETNAVGYFHDPDQHLTLDQPGVWTVRLRAICHGWTSAGAVQEPYPAGSAPGAVAGAFSIYVLPEGAPVARLTNFTVAEARVPVALAFNLSVAVPQGWQGVRAHYTVALPGMILDSGAQPVSGEVFTYNYDPRRLNQAFPNLDVVRAGTQTPVSADTVTLTLALVGTDAGGQPAVTARTVTLFGDRLVTVYEGWAAPE